MKQKFTSTFAALLLAAAAIGLLTGASANGTLQSQTPDTEFSAADMPNQVDLYFPSNPTTGYDWQAAAEDPDLVEIKDQFFEYNHEEGLVGVGGTHWFHLSGLKPGTTSVTFRYLRSWDPDSVVSETLYRLTVDEDMNVLIWGVEVSDLG